MGQLFVLHEVTGKPHCDDRLLTLCQNRKWIMYSDATRTVCWCQ